MPTGIITYDITPLQGAFASAFLILINALFFNVKLIGEYNQYPVDVSPKLINGEETTFDFIIVGAGAAGCALANRLSEQEQWSVLLLEAGNYPQTTTAVPALFPTFFDSSADTWQYQLAKDKDNCRAYRNKRCWMFRGRVVGGTSSVNNLHYYREYNLEKSTKNIYESIEYMPATQSENIYRREIHLEKGIANAQMKTVLKKGYEHLKYYGVGEKNPIGFLENYLMLKNGERFNMARAFLTPVKNRSNFFFAKNAVVQGIVTNEPADKRAKGVNVTISDVKVFLQARKELILTAGAINNAKLLMVSGFGSRDYLEKRKIHTIAHVPGVGKGLQIHVAVPMFFSLNVTYNNTEASSEIDLIKDVFDYIMFRTGNLANIGIHDASLYMSSTENPTDLTVAIHHNLFNVQDKILTSWLEGLKFDQKIISKITEKNQNQPILMFLLTLIRPQSRGEIALNETHFQGNPNVIGNFLTDKEGGDMQSLLNAFALVQNVSETPQLKDVGAEFMNIGVPDCTNYKFCSIHYVKCYIQNLIYPTSSVSGTTLMGPECDRNAVVNRDFEVKNMRCLRIGDSSVLSDIPLGNTVATDAMLGVSLSEVLKEKWVKDYVSPFKQERN